MGGEAYIQTLVDSLIERRIEVREELPVRAP